MARVEGNKHLFDVIKVNMFNVKQARVMMIEHPTPGCGHTGRVCIATEGGKVKRDLDVSAIAGIEKTKGSQDDVERSVTFKFFEKAGGSEAKRTILFVSKRQRDAFVEEIEMLNPKLVMRRKDGTLSSMEEKKQAVDGAKADAAKLAKTVLARGSSFHGDAGGADVGELNDVMGDQFFAMEENEFGFLEPRVLAFSPDGVELTMIDATAGGTGSLDLRLARLKSVALHAMDKTTVMLAFHGGGIASAQIARILVLSFGSRGARGRFHSELVKRVQALAAETAARKVKGETVETLEPFDTDDKWRAALPTKSFVRFEATRLKPKKTAVVLLVNVRRRKVYVFKTASIPQYAPGSLIPTGCPVEVIFSISPARCQLMRSPTNARVLCLGESSATTPFPMRQFEELEFGTMGDRERFAGYAALASSLDDALEVTDIAAQRKGEGAPGGLPTRAPSGTVRSTYRPPAHLDTSPLWRASWPADDVKVWVGTYNVSGVAPPADLAALDAWVPAPARDAAGARDLYVFGLQELGPASNREAWAAALAKHLARGKSSVAGATTTIAQDAAQAAEFAYLPVGSVFMWEMGVYLFARAPHVPDITAVSCAELPTGLAIAKAITGVQLGNKGGVGVALKWRETSLAFVLCHLAARPDAVRLRKREADYRALTRKLKLETSFGSSAGLDFVHAHDHVWFFGDMNYRIDLPFDRTVALAKAKNYGAILAHDQLIREQGKRKVFVGFNEGRIEFAPTYRWEKERDEFSNKRAQAPSFTDRILHRSLPGHTASLTQTAYESPNKMYGSDHRAVSASYSLALKRYYAPPVAPLAYTPYPVPTFYTALDAPNMPVPIITMAGIKVSGLQALTAPAAVYLRFGTGLSFTDSPVATSTGLTDKQKESLRALKLELADMTKKAEEKAKVEAKEAKAAAAKAKKEGKGASKAPSEWQTEGAMRSPKAAGGLSGLFGAKAKEAAADKGKAGAAEPAPAVPPPVEHDSEDEEDDGDGEGEGYKMDDADASHAAAAAAAAASVMEQALADPVKKALLELCVEYTFPDLPALVPTVWDPRVLRRTHIHVMMLAAPGPDGLMSAIGDKKAKDVAKDELIGAATVPLVPMVENAKAAVELAWSIQAEEEEGGKGGRGSKVDTAMPPLPSPLACEVMAVTTGVAETTADLFARAYTPAGIPWALTAPPVSFSVDIELGGQPTCTLTGSSALRSNLDPTFVGKTGVPSSPGWQLSSLLTTIERASREAKALGPLVSRLPGLQALDEHASLDRTPADSGAGLAEEAASMRSLFQAASAGGVKPVANTGFAKRSVKKTSGSFATQSQIGKTWSHVDSPDRAGGSFAMTTTSDSEAVGSGESGGEPSPRPSFGGSFAGGSFDAHPPPALTMPGPPPSGAPMPQTAAAPPSRFAPPTMPGPPGAGALPPTAFPPGRAMPPTLPSPSGAASGMAATASRPSKGPTLPTVPTIPGALVAGRRVTIPGMAVGPAPPSVEGAMAVLEEEGAEEAPGMAAEDAPSAALVEPPVRTVLRPRTGPRIPNIPSAAAASLLSISGAAAGSAPAAAVAVDARFAAFFEAQFAKKMAPAPVAEGGALPPSLPAKKKALTIPGAAGAMPSSMAAPPKRPTAVPAANSSAGAEAGVEASAEAPADGAAVEAVEAAAPASVMIGGFKLPPKAKPAGMALPAGLPPKTALPFNLPPKLNRTASTAAVGEAAAAGSAEAEATQSEAEAYAPEAEAEAEADGEGEEAGEEAEEAGAAGGFFDDSDDDEEEEDEDDAEMVAALAAAAAKRAVMAVKIMSRADEIRDSLAAAITRSKAETSEGVVKYLMPSSAAAEIAKNVRSAVGTTTHGMGYDAGAPLSVSRGAASAITFAGVSKLASEAAGIGAAPASDKPASKWSTLRTAVTSKAPATVPVREERPALRSVAHSSAPASAPEAEGNADPWMASAPGLALLAAAKARKEAGAAASSPAKAAFRAATSPAPAVVATAPVEAAVEEAQPAAVEEQPAAVEEQPAAEAAAEEEQPALEAAEEEQPAAETAAADEPAESEAAAVEPPFGEVEAVAEVVAAAVVSPVAFKLPPKPKAATIPSAAVESVAVAEPVAAPTPMAQAFKLPPKVKPVIPAAAAEAAAEPAPEAAGEPTAAAPTVPIAFKLPPKPKAAAAAAAAAVEEEVKPEVEVPAAAAAESSVASPGAAAMEALKAAKMARKPTIPGGLA